MPKKSLRGLAGVLIDVLSWLRIYRQRAFWVQIAAVIVGVLLWIIILPSEEVAGAIAASLVLIFLNVIMTNIVWAISRKPYSCIIGGSIGYGLYNFAVGVVVYHLSLTDVLAHIALGAVYGFVFTWFAFLIFYLIGLIKVGERKEEQKPS